jgi:D-amino-acid dehydrogenase
VRVFVIGAGVIGVASAWYLAGDGHEVTVFERTEGPALETSFANAGGVCPGFAGPWAAPGMPLKALKWMGQAHAPFRLRPRADPAQWRWLAAFLRNCTAARFARNKARMQRMAHYSRACLEALRAETGIAYDHGTDGVLQVFFTQDELAGGRRAAVVLAGMGVAHRLVGRDAALEIEPALARGADADGARLVGGLHLPGDETGDCHLFTRALADLAAERGVRFRYGCEVRELIARSGRIAALRTTGGEETADAVVLATGPWAPHLLAPLGIRLPVYPVKGYAMTCALTDPDAAPRSSVMDEHSKVMVTRLGTRLRAAGSAELTGFTPGVPEAARRALSGRVRFLFPDAADYDTAEFWFGFRPMTPDGPARIGPTGFPNLFLNTGQGSNGWTQACGSGRILADLVAGRTPEVLP